MRSHLVTKITSMQVLQHQATGTGHDVRATSLQDVIIVNKREEER